MSTNLRNLIVITISVLAIIALFDFAISAVFARADMLIENILSF